MALHNNAPEWQIVPFTRAVAVTTSDDTDLDDNAVSLWIGGAGNVKVTTVEDDTVTFNGCTAGSVLPVQVKRVWATGTTATNIVALRTI